MSREKQLNRPTPEGRALGEQMARLISEPIMQIALQGEPDARCSSCAFRQGTIPNGCPETQMDALKCVMEGTPFYCHMKEPRETCHGWYAGRYAVRGETRRCPWKFTTEYEEEAKRNGGS